MISVVVPVYNIEKYIVSCISSIVAQEYRDFELLLVDDGSKDNSIALAEDYLKDQDAVYRIIRKENGGLASARNEGLKNAKGDYVVFIDGDDCITKDFLKELSKNIGDHDFSFCAFTFVKSQEISEDDDDKKTVFDKETLLNTFLKRTISFVVPSMLFKKSFLIDNGLFFDEQLRFSEDQPFIWKVILHSETSIYLYRKMYGYYVRENSIMTSTSYDRLAKSHQEYQEVIRDIFRDYPEYKQIEEKILPRWELGALYTAAGLLIYEDYKKLYEQMNGRSILKRISGIGEIKAYLLAAVSSISVRLMYNLCRRMDLNG